MKRELIIISLALVLIIMPGLVKSQEINFGIKGGLTLSNLYIDEEDLDDENARLGFNAGFISQFMFVESFGIQPEFLFTTKGTEGNYAGIINQSVKFNLHYIDIPILLVIRPIPVMEIHLGPYAGFLVDSDIKFTGTIYGETTVDRDHFNTLDYGLAGGLGFNFGNFQAGVRYHLGLQEIADSTPTRLLLGDSKNSYGQLYIAIRFKDRFAGVM